MSTAKERIVKSESAKKILNRCIDPIYENSEIMCSIMEVIGRFNDKLVDYMKEIHQQANIDTATWGLKSWSDEYAVPISSGMTYAEVRRLIYEKKRRILPPNEYNLAKYLTKQTGRECFIIQWVAPYKFYACFLSGANEEPFSYKKAYKLIKDARQAHLCFDIVPVFKSDYVISDTKIIYKFRNPMASSDGLRAGLFPRFLNLGRAYRTSIVMEVLDEHHKYNNVFTGTKPNVANEVKYKFDNYLTENDDRHVPYEIGVTGLRPGVAHYNHIIETNESEFYDIKNLPAGIIPVEAQGDKESSGTAISSESQTYSIVNTYCGEEEYYFDGE